MRDLFGRYCYIDTPWIAGKKTRYRIIGSGAFSNAWYEIPFTGGGEPVIHAKQEEIVFVVLDTLVGDDSVIRRFALKDVELIGRSVDVFKGDADDIISRLSAIDAIANLMPSLNTPDGSHPADQLISMAQEIFVDAMEAVETLPYMRMEAACDGCKYKGWGESQAPCASCLRRACDKYEKVPADVRDCTTCRFGWADDHWNTPTCHHTCHNWEQWEPKTVNET